MHCLVGRCCLKQLDTASNLTLIAIAKLNIHIIFGQLDLWQAIPNIRELRFLEIARCTNNLNISLIYSSNYKRIITFTTLKISERIVDRVGGVHRETLNFYFSGIRLERRPTAVLFFQRP